MNSIHIYGMGWFRWKDEEELQAKLAALSEEDRESVEWALKKLEEMKRDLKREINRPGN